VSVRMRPDSQKASFSRMPLHVNCRWLVPIRHCRALSFAFCASPAERFGEASVPSLLGL
jgi:hypothetical protein